MSDDATCQPAPMNLADDTVVTYGRAAQSLAAMGAVLLVALHGLKPDLSPLSRFVSEYAVGSFGVVMRVTFFACGATLLCLGRAYHAGASNRPWRIGVVAALFGGRRDDGGRTVFDGSDDDASRPDDARGPAPRVYRDDRHAGAADWRRCAGLGPVACGGSRQAVPCAGGSPLVCEPRRPGRLDYDNHGRRPGD